MLVCDLVDSFHLWNSRHRAPATLAFYRTRLKKSREAYQDRTLDALTPLEIDEHLAEAGAGMSDSTRHHNVVALERLQKFALEHKRLDKLVFGKLEKPRAGQLDRVPTPDETEAVLSRSSREFRLIFSALRQCGAHPCELCRATIADIDRTANAIVLREHKTAWKTGKPRRIPIGRKLGELLTQAIGEREAGPVFLSPAGKPWTVPNLSRTYSRLRDMAGLRNEVLVTGSRGRPTRKMATAFPMLKGDSGEIFRQTVQNRP